MTTRLAAAAAVRSSVARGHDKDRPDGDAQISDYALHRNLSRLPLLIVTALAVKAHFCLALATVLL